MGQHDDRIASAVATCLALAAAADQPLERAAELSVLLKSAGWTDAEISEVGSRVRACLMRRRSSDGRPECSPDTANGEFMTGHSQSPFAGQERRSGAAGTSP